MDEKEIIRALKSERCPSSVLKQVQATIRSEKSPFMGWRWKLPVGISITLVVLLSLILVNIGDDSTVSENIASPNSATDSMKKTIPAATADEDYLAEAQELKFALTYIGLALREETERNRNIILSRTIPVVKDSIENTEEYINDRLRRKRSL